MSILKAPPKQPKNAMIQVRVAESIKLNLDRYAEFIGGKQAYIVSEALRLLFKKDEEFKRWVEMHSLDNNHNSIQEGALTKTL